MWILGLTSGGVFCSLALVIAVRARDLVETLIKSVFLCILFSTHKNIKS